MRVTKARYLRSHYTRLFFSILYLNKNAHHFENLLWVYHEMDIKNMSRSVLGPLGLDSISPQTGFFRKPLSTYTQSIKYK